MKTYDDPVPFDLVDWGLLFDDDAFTLEPTVLLPEAALQNCVCSNDLLSRDSINYSPREKCTSRKTYDIILLQCLCVRLSGRSVPDKDIETFCTSFDFVSPLHDCDSWTKRV